MPDFGTMYATWTDPSGTVWQLSNTDDDLGWFTVKGPGGWGAAPVEIITDPVSTGGVTVRIVRVNERRLTWPLEVWGDTHVEFLERYRNIMNAFCSTTQLQSPGTLTVSRPDGTSRSIDCFYEDGFSGNPGENWSFARPVLTLLCPEPYWRSTTTVSETRAFSTPVPFLTAYPTVSNSNSLGDSTMTNPGDVEAWPTFSITGPMTAMTAINNTTGDSFVVTQTLLAGETMTITTNPPTASGPLGENFIAALNFPSATLWPLRPGDNEVSFNASGSASGTEVTVSFAPRFEAA